MEVLTGIWVLLLICVLALVICRTFLLDLLEAVVNTINTYIMSNDVGVLDTKNNAGTEALEPVPENTVPVEKYQFDIKNTCILTKLFTKEELFEQLVLLKVGDGMLSKNSLIALFGGNRAETQTKIDQLRKRVYGETSDQSIP